PLPRHSLFLFFNDPAPTEISTLSLHDALPISLVRQVAQLDQRLQQAEQQGTDLRRQAQALAQRRAELEQQRDAFRRQGYDGPMRDRKSTRLNSSHLVISYAVFCLKKKNNNTTQ